MNRRWKKAYRLGYYKKGHWYFEDSSRREIASMPKQHILDQLQIATWDMVPRKYDEINHTVAAWLGVSSQKPPRLKWYGAYEKGEMALRSSSLHRPIAENGSSGIFLRGTDGREDVILVRCSTARTEILQTIYHELLHYYLPLPLEATIQEYEKAIFAGAPYNDLGR